MDAVRAFGAWEHPVSRSIYFSISFVLPLLAMLVAAKSEPLAAAPSQATSATRSEADLAKARTAFKEKQEATFGRLSNYNPTQVALTAIGLTRAQLVERFKIECPKWPSEPNVANPKWWSYTWKMLDPIDATFYFNDAGLVEDVKLVRTPGRAFSRKLGQFWLMSDHLGWHMPKFAYQIVRDKDYKPGRSPKLRLKTELMQGYIDTKGLIDRGEHKGMVDTVGQFLITIKNPTGSSYITMLCAEEAAYLCEQKRTLDTKEGIYKNSYKFFLPRAWSSSPLLEVRVHRKPWLPFPDLLKVPVPVLPAE